MVLYTLRLDQFKTVGYRGMTKNWFHGRGSCMSMHIKRVFEPYT